MDAVSTVQLPFRPGSMTWRVNMEPVVGLGGGRALLLQVLHPLVAAGVEQHSNFQTDPWSRGFRTLDVMLKLAFADPATSARQAQLLHGVHRRVEGTSRDGVPYRALDPDLLVWVWATLVDASITMYERGVRPLSRDERERYYEEQKLVAYACGVPVGACPAMYEDFVRYMDAVISSELHVTSVARVVAYGGRKPPLPWPLGPLVGTLTSLFAAGLLPERFRGPLGFEWSPRRERMLRGAFAAFRASARVVPRPIRHMPNRYLTRRTKPLQWWRGRDLRVPAGLLDER
jgi:uncharacterized protein (DUF2236 family)